jgi:uncharacterized protein (TIGR03437 family)
MMSEAWLLAVAMAVLAPLASSQEPGQLMVPRYSITLPIQETKGLVTDAYGNSYFWSVTTNFAVSKLDTAGKLIYRVPLEPCDSIAQMVPDGNGDLYFVGSLSGISPCQPGMYVKKIDAAGNVAYNFSAQVAADPSAIAVSTDGSVYVTGSADPAALPTTPGVAVPSGKATPNINAFVMKLTSKGELEYTTFLDNSAVGSQNGRQVLNYAQAITADASGSAVVAGTTTDNGFPVTGGGTGILCNCGSEAAAVFVVKLAPDGSHFSYSSLIASGSAQYTGVSLLAMTLQTDATGTATVRTLTAPAGYSGIPMTNTSFTIRSADLNPTGNAIASETVTMFSSVSPPQVASDAQGNYLITGQYADSNLPVSNGAFSNGTNYFAIVHPGDGKLLYSTRLPFGMGGTGVASDGNGGLILLGGGRGSAYGPALSLVTRFAPASQSGPTVLGVANAAGFQLSSLVAPGELVSIYGVGLGPKRGVSSNFNTDGKLPRNLSGTQVFFDGISAPLLYASDEQVNAVVPFSVRGRETSSVLLLVNGVESNQIYVPEGDAEPAIFSAGYLSDPGYPTAFVVNQDGTVNSQTNPAHVGSVVSIFVSGAGLLVPTPEDGAQPGIGPRVALPISVTLQQYNIAVLCQAPAEVAYAGAAPTLVAGILQVNFRLSAPCGLAPGSIVLSVGDRLAVGYLFATGGSPPGVP